MRKPHKYTKWSFYYLPQIKRGLKLIGVFLLILLAELVILGIGGQTFPF